VGLAGNRNYTVGVKLAYMSLENRDFGSVRLAGPNIRIKRGGGLRFLGLGRQKGTVKRPGGG
jgi:hypothetical protein